MYWKFILIIVSVLFSSYAWEGYVTGIKNHKQLIPSVIVPTKIISVHSDSLIPKYHLDTVGLNATTFFDNYTEYEKDIILSINRKTIDRIRRNNKLIIPDTFYLDFKMYSPFPNKLIGADSLSKLIVISLRVQAFGAFQNGELIRWGPVNTGKKSTPTPKGLFYTNWKSVERRSSINYDWIMPWYFNFESRRGLALHEYTLPGYPASHACVRLIGKDAYWIYNWADQWVRSPKTHKIIKNGTPLIIIGEYEFYNTRPWLKLAEDPFITFMNAEELSEVAYHLNQLITQNERTPDQGRKEHPELKNI